MAFTIAPLDLNSQQPEQIARLLSDTFPFLIVTGDTIRNGAQATAPNEHRIELVAIDDSGNVIARGYSRVNTEVARAGTITSQIVVSRARRKESIGTLMLDRFAKHWAVTGAKIIQTRTCDDESADFARRHGFHVSRAERISGVELSDIPDQLPLPSGYTIKSLAEVGYRELHKMDTLVVADIPADDPWLAMPYEEWHRKYGTDPRTDEDCTLFVYHNDEPVSLAWVQRDGTRLWSALTGTVSQYRGKNLAKILKSRVLHRARQLGATTAYTNNDAENKPMLAINNWLGYSLAAEQTAWVKELQ